VLVVVVPQLSPAVRDAVRGLSTITQLSKRGINFEETTRQSAPRRAALGYSDRQLRIFLPNFAASSAALAGQYGENPRLMAIDTTGTS